MVSRQEEIPSTQVEWAGNQELVQYREHLMPLIRLARALGISAYQADEPPELMQVVVCGHNGARIGLVVDEIVDVVEESVALQRNKRQDIVLGVAVIQSKVTELLNVERIIQVADVDFLEDYEPMEAPL
jgi:two-component system chemotaxis sensor kinase CheA